MEVAPHRQTASSAQESPVTDAYHSAVWQPTDKYTRHQSVPQYTMLHCTHLTHLLTLASVRCSASPFTRA